LKGEEGRRKESKKKEKRGEKSREGQNYSSKSN
jgi:hypothetical protein